MVRRLLGLLLALILLLPRVTAAQVPTFVVDIEAGPVWQSDNAVEIPNDDTATRFSLVQLAGTGPWPAGRAYVTWNLNPRHALRVLVAPLSFTKTGFPDQPLVFAGEQYAPGEATRATYTFNSYRLTYRYRLYAGDQTTGWVGVTAKMRDAQIALRQRTATSRKKDLGFVPLLHLSGEWRLASDWRLNLDVDAVAGGPGRAIDAAVKLGYDLEEKWTIQAGYRTIEGGADVTEVYNFAWLHYATLSLSWRLLSASQLEPSSPGLR